MRRHNTRVVLCGIALACGLCACEYEWKEERRGPEPVLPPMIQSEKVQVIEPEKKVESAERPVLAPGKDVSGTMAIPANTKKLNLPEMAENGAVTVSSNVSGLGDLANAYDEVETTLTKSENINPFKVTFEFKEPHLIKAIRVLSSYSDYAWAVQLESGDRLVIDSVIDGEWSTTAFPEGIKIQKVTIDVLRKLRDNYVHLNEIEFYE